MTLNGAEGAGRADTGRGNPASLADQIRALSPPPLGDGSYDAQDDVFSSDEEMEFFVTSVRARVPKAWCDETVARTWGRLSAETRRAGRPSPVNDMWNAACCIAAGLPLATLNVKDYQDFADHHGLQLIQPK